MSHPPHPHGLTPLDVFRAIARAYYADPRGGKGKRFKFRAFGISLGLAPNVIENERQKAMMHTETQRKVMACPVNATPTGRSFNWVVSDAKGRGAKVVSSR